MIVNEKVIACYIRLSEDDEDTAKGLKDESNSVTAQRNLIQSHIAKDRELNTYPIREYVDDGYTGTTFTRPGYEKLMDDAKKDNNLTANSFLRQRMSTEHNKARNTQKLMLTLFKGR